MTATGSLFTRIYYLLQEFSILNLDFQIQNYPFKNNYF